MRKKDQDERAHNGIVPKRNDLAGTCFNSTEVNFTAIILY
jgi:hypothetical protein